VPVLKRPSLAGSKAPNDIRTRLELVQEIANDEYTLNASGTEAACNVSDEYPKAKAAEAEFINQNVRRERELAQMLLDASEGFYTPPPALDSQ